MSRRICEKLSRKEGRKCHACPRSRTFRPVTFDSRNNIRCSHFPDIDVRESVIAAVGGQDGLKFDYIAEFISLLSFFFDLLTYVNRRVRYLPSLFLSARCNTNATDRHATVDTRFAYIILVLHTSCMYACTCAFSLLRGNSPASFWKLTFA